MVDSLFVCLFVHLILITSLSFRYLKIELEDTQEYSKALAYIKKLSIEEVRINFKYKQIINRKY